MYMALIQYLKFFQWCYIFDLCFYFFFFFHNDIFCNYKNQHLWICHDIYTYIYFTSNIIRIEYQFSSPCFDIFHIFMLNTETLQFVILYFLNSIVFIVWCERHYFIIILCNLIYKWDFVTKNSVNLLWMWPVC